VNHSEVGELLDRAAAAVTPAEPDPAARLARLGRRSVRRRRAVWGAAGAATAVLAVAPAVTPPRVTAPPPDAPAVTVALSGLAVDVPDGWRTSEVPSFDPCTAQPRTVYLAATYAESGAFRGVRGGDCEAAGQEWIAIVTKGVGVASNSPDRLTVKDGRLLVAEPEPMAEATMWWSYRVFDRQPRAVTAFISAAGDQDRDRLLEHVTWPTGDPAPSAEGGLKLPRRITIAISDVPPSNGMRVARDPETLSRIRAKLTALHDQVPVGEECDIRKPGLVGVDFGDVTVVLGDASCPQAISTAGGRVRVPPGLGQEVQALVVEGETKG
jgi:hypothetical protein